MVSTNNRFIAILLFVVAGLLCPRPALALESKTHTLTLGPSISYATYKDDTMKETGVYYGAVGSYTYRGGLFNDRLPSAMVKVEGRLTRGRMQFDGRLLDGNTYKIDNVKDFITEVRATGGYDFSVGESTRVTPYAGLGYRYWSDGLAEHDAGYRRRSHYLYSPVGVDIKTPLADSWSVGANMEFDLFWHGWQETNFSDLDRLYSDVVNDQTKGFGLRGSVTVHKQLATMNFIFEPYVNYWNIKSSDAEPLRYNGLQTGTYREPASTTTEMGVRVVVEY